MVEVKPFTTKAIMMLVADSSFGNTIPEMITQNTGQNNMQISKVFPCWDLNASQHELIQTKSPGLSLTMWFMNLGSQNPKVKKRKDGKVRSARNQ